MLNDEEKQRKAVAKARKANELLSNETFSEVVGEMKSEIFKKWQSTTDPGERDRCWVAVNLIDRIVDGLGRAIANGKLANAAIEKMLAEKARKTG